MILFIIILIFLILTSGIPSYLSWLYYGKFLVFSAIAIPALIVLGVFVNKLLVKNDWLFGSFIVSQIGFYLVAVLMVLFGFVIVGALSHHIGGISARLVVLGVLILTFVFVVITRIHGERIEIYDIHLESEKISRSYHFVQLSDIHRGSTGEKHLERIIHRVEQLNPEFVVITGDFIDMEYVTSASIKAFQELSMPIFLITGNHEYYLKEGKIGEVIAESNIILIDDMKIAFDELDIIGVNELSTIARSVDMVGGLDTDRYSIVLYHQPKTHEVESANNLGADLMLSGHTHKGQVWPLGLLIQKFQFKYLAGLYSVGDMNLYVNQGTGTWGPKMRLGSVNEITSIRLSSE